jgi:hypothetical protein
LSDFHDPDVGAVEQGSGYGFKEQNPHHGKNQVLREPAHPCAYRIGVPHKRFYHFPHMRSLIETAVFNVSPARRNADGVKTTPPASFDKEGPCPSSIKRRLPGPQASAREGETVPDKMIPMD